MKNDINKVAQAVIAEISKHEAGKQADNGSVHKMLGMTKREAEANQMAGYFVAKIEKIEKYIGGYEAGKEVNPEYRQAVEAIVEKVFEQIEK